MQSNRKINHPIWITWENQRRNREIAKRIGATLYEWEKIDEIKITVKKYLLGLIKTAILLLKERPRIVFCQNPSIVLSLFICLINRVFPIKGIVDAHNAGLYPMDGRSRILLSISKFIQKNAFLTIVTNEPLKVQVQKFGGKALVLPDPIPDLKPPPQIIEFQNSFTALFVCSFSDDEPYENVFKAAQYLNGSDHIFVTGDYRCKAINPSLLPKSINLLGFIPEVEFVKLLFSVDVVIDLTNRENCLVCGAYESIAAEKPMILSNTKALKDFFYQGAVFTDNSPKSIRRSIQTVKNEYKRLKNEICELKITKQTEWQQYVVELNEIIYDHSHLIDKGLP